MPLVLACLALFLAAPANAAIREIGQYEDAPFPAASCPENCQAIAQVTGYQERIGEHRNPFRMTRGGRIVGFTIRLGDPNAEQLEYFRTTFGSTSQIRISVVRPDSKRRRHRLLRHSPVYKLDNYFGSTPTFAFGKSLRVEKGEAVALTVRTWVPAFAHGLPTDNTWRASHDPDSCTSPNPPAADQESINGLRYWGCFYRTARLLYSVHFVPDPKPTKTR